MSGLLEGRLGARHPQNMSEITPQIVEKIVENLSFIQKLTLRIRGSLFVDKVKFDGWSGELPLYLFKCDLHGYELSYPHGHDMRLVCLDCLRMCPEEMSDPSKIIIKKYINGNKEEENAEIPAITLSR